MAQKPGENKGKGGGIYQEVRPKGGKKESFATVPDNKHLPPTSSAGNQWQLVRRTPNSKR